MSRAARTAALRGAPDEPHMPLQVVSPKPDGARSRVQKRRAEPEISWAYFPRIQPGDYPAVSRSAAFYWDRQFKRWSCAVQFNILNDSHMEVVARLTWYLNLGPRETPHASRRGKYWAAWVKANGGPPTRKDRLSPRTFKGRYAIVRVEDTTKSHDQNAIAAQDGYSVIRDVVRWETERPQR